MGKERRGKQLPSTVSPGPVGTNFLPRLCHAEQPKDACSRLKKSRSLGVVRTPSGQSMKAQPHKTYLQGLHLPGGPADPRWFARFVFLPSLVPHVVTVFYPLHSAYHSCMCAWAVCSVSATLASIRDAAVKMPGRCLQFPTFLGTDRQAGAGYSNSTSC